MDILAFAKGAKVDRRVTSLNYNQESEPTAVEVGTEWYVPTTGKTYKLINDGSNNVWVDTSTVGTAAVDKGEEFTVGTASGDYDGVSLNTFPTVKGYVPGYVTVNREGLTLGKTEFIATDGIAVVLVEDADVGDTILVQGFGNFLLADHYDKSEVDGFLSAQNDEIDLKADQATTYTETEVDTLLDVKIDSDITETGTSVIENIVKISQADYDLLTPVATTFYVIVGQHEVWNIECR